MIFNMVGGGAEVASMIIVNHPADATSVECVGSTSKKSISTTKTVFGVSEVRTYTVTATNGTLSASKDVEVLAIGSSYEITLGFFYGIQRDITSSSPTWTRTGGAVGFTFSASVGSTAGHSDFDTVYPWSGITRETIDGDVMVKIPKFWFKRYRDGNIEHIEICGGASSGYDLHPAFQHNGATQDYIYVGAYKMTSGYKSTSGAYPLNNLTRSAFRTGASNRGTGYGIIDITTLSAIQMLIMVEIANNDVQSVIGAGVTASGTSTINTGSCDTVPNLTGVPTGTVGTVDVVWRGIEGLWGNIWEDLDGLNCNSGTYYYCNNQSLYADDTATNYTQLSYSGTTWGAGSFITQVGLDTSNSAIMLPNAAGGTGASGTTYYADATHIESGWRCLRRGCNAGSTTYAGISCVYFDYTSSYIGIVYSSRLIKIP